MSIYLRHVAALMLVAASTGCSIMPFPHMASKTPPIEGTIAANGDPAVGLRIRIATGTENDPCAGDYEETDADELGNFAVKSVRYFQPFLLIMAHGFFEWNLCYKSAGHWYKITGSKEYALVDTGPTRTIKVHCEIAIENESDCQFLAPPGYESAI